MIRLFLTDVDGTLTDGKINIGSNGEVFKSFNVKDGYGLKKLMTFGIIPVVITGRASRIVEARCFELGIHALYQNVSDKADMVKQIATKYNIDFSQIAYIGDDENDLEAMNMCGLSFAPKDAIKSVKENVDIVLETNGGDGCVREAIDIIIEKYIK